MMWPAMWVLPDVAAIGRCYVPLSFAHFDVDGVATSEACAERELCAGSL